MLGQRSPIRRNEAMVELDGALSDPVLAANIYLENADARVVWREATTPEQVTHAHA